MTGTATGRTRRRALHAIACLGLLVSVGLFDRLGGAAPAPDAAAEVGAVRAGAARVAAVTVDFGDGRIVQRTFAFSETSVSGIEALRRAGFTVDVYAYSGLGGAVCRINGVGRPPDASCLDGGTAYWGYWRNGTYSRAGAGSTQVQDHDQEQWKWGTGGSAPPTTAWPVATTPPASRAPATSLPATAPPAVGSGGGAASPPSGGGAPSSTAAGAAGSPPGASTTRPVSATSRGTVGASTTGPSSATSVGDRSRAESAAVVAATAAADAPADDGGRAAPWSLLGFAAVLLALAALVVRARLHRP